MFVISVFYCVACYRNFSVNQKATIFVNYVIKEFAHAFNCAYIELWIKFGEQSRSTKIHCHGLQRNKTAPVRSFELWNIHQTFCLLEKMVEISGIVLQQLVNLIFVPYINACPCNQFNKRHHTNQ